jgi:hypothetical protein
LRSQLASLADGLSSVEKVTNGKAPRKFKANIGGVLNSQK